MRVLLPPSETKRGGGFAGQVDINALAFSELAPTRSAVARAVMDLARTPEECLRVLKLGPKLGFEVDRNAALLTSPSMPAVDRYTGVLFDGLDTASLVGHPRAELLAHTFIQSALWGPVSAGDAIPAYRLSCTSRLPALGRGLAALWGEATSGLASLWTDFTLDMRSEGYAALTPIPDSADAVYLRVVTRDGAGHVTALTHFNKKAKGEFLRSLAISGGLATVTSRDDLLAWASSGGWILENTLGAPLKDSRSDADSARHDVYLVV